MTRDEKRIVLGQRLRLKRIAQILGLSVLIALLYPIFAREFTDWLAFVNAAFVGLLAGSLIAWNEDRNNYFRHRRNKFISSFLRTAIIYIIGFSLSVIVVYSITRSIENGMGVFEFIRSDQFREFILHEDFGIIILYAIFLGAVLSFTFSMSRKIEGNLLRNMINGRYATPRHEIRIVLFIDLDDSTKLAEQLEISQYFNLLNDFFADITPAILMARGSIYRYVGDQVTVTWPFQRGIKNGRCIKAVLKARGEIKRQREKYFVKYGLVPSFKASVHCGEVIVGEIGDVKSQIVMHGDVLYLTNEIEKAAKKYGSDFVVSRKIAEEVELPALYEFSKLGVLELQGTGENMELYTVKEKAG